MATDPTESSPDGDVGEFLDATEPLEFLAQPSNKYDTWQAVNAYDRDEGIIQLPVADDEEVDAEIIQVVQPFGTRTVTITARREGQWPQVPDPFKFADNDRLQNSRVEAATPIPLSTGAGYIYQITCVYTFLCLRALKPGTDDFPTATTPYTNDTLEENNWPASDFIGGLCGDPDQTEPTDLEEEGSSPGGTFY